MAENTGRTGGDAAATDADSEEAPAPPSPSTGGIENMGFLDLRGAKTAEDLAHITSITNVGTILISEQLGAALARIPMKNVGSVIPLPDGVRIKMQMGELRLSGEALAGGDPDEILFVMGELTITSLVREVGYREIRVMGEVTAPVGSESALSPKLTLMGEILYLPEGARHISGEVTLGRDYFEMLPDATALVVTGIATIEDGVPADLLRGKLPELIVTGQLFAPSELLSLLTALALRTSDKVSGQIVDKAERQSRHERRSAPESPPNA
jgi:hypothetical protein